MNKSVAELKCGFYLNDVKLISDDWVQEMMGVCQRPDVGVIGAKLSYADDTIQHAGVVIGLGGIAGHCFNGVQHLLMSAKSSPQNGVIMQSRIIMLIFL